MKLNELYFEVIKTFEENNIESPSFEAKELIKHFIGLDETQFLLRRNDEIDSECAELIKASLVKRLSGEPLQYIIGKWDFMNSTFKVGRGVLIPRPETEILCDTVIEHIRNFEKPVVFDLCSGSGCIGISVKMAVNKAEVFLFEKSDKAFSYLLENVKNICFGDVKAINADIFEMKIFEDLPLADVIVSNPPYIKTDEISTLQKEVQFEPVMALDGGADGLIFYRFIISEWKKLLKSFGIFAFECGEEQAGDISRLLDENGFDSQIIKDYNNLDRIVIGRRRQ